MSAEYSHEKTKFNIVQFAHQILPYMYHGTGTQCNRLKPFTACWNLLQKICGSKVRGFAHHAALFVEVCKIQSEMDAAGCPWQDMLLRHYLQASRVTAWPMNNQCAHNPLALEKSINFSTDIDTLIPLLEPAVKEISSKCGSPAKRLARLLEKLRYLQYHAWEYNRFISRELYRKP